MSAARKCDRCGTLYEPKGVGTYFKLSRVDKSGDVIGEVKAMADLKIAISDRRKETA